MTTGDEFLAHPALTRMKTIAHEYFKILSAEKTKLGGTPVRVIDDRMVSDDGVYTSNFKIALLENTKYFERANYGVWDNWGTFTKKSEEDATGNKSTGAGLKFRATGFSLVYHPKSPYLPSTRIHYHMFYREDGAWWLSGGPDETPTYFNVADVVEMHQVYKNVCDKHLGDGWYDKLKQFNDEYFLIPHRNAIRGTSGIFFDHFNKDSVWNQKHDLFTDADEETAQTKLLDFCEDLCSVIVGQYFAKINRLKDTPYTPKQVELMHLLRGRYVEYDLMLDRGIRFGVSTKMPMKNILIALPVQAKWIYDWEATYQSGNFPVEQNILRYLSAPTNWLDLNPEEYDDCFTCTTSVQNGSSVF